MAVLMKRWIQAKVSCRHTVEPRFSGGSKPRGGAAVIFIYASIVLVVLIILGVVFTIITMRRLHSTQKQLQKQDKASTKEKKYDWYGH